jgi:hypothetical protein
MGSLLILHSGRNNRQQKPPKARVAGGDLRPQIRRSQETDKLISLQAFQLTS